MGHQWFDKGHLPEPIVKRGLFEPSLVIRMAIDNGDRDESRVRGVSDPPQLERSQSDTDVRRDYWPITNFVAVSCDFRQKKRILFQF
ncbi:hypothetical protein EVAR_16709_1 [Eumeta japonica]|uniref:Uncharacterized protein n=1 Tax=Eumeta variegata TaxID=151549 RepID=A0A4C1V5X7_EUMVA|nr:hypothetical protein EVAR_16709_1 [Eumeta japonica]